MGGAVGRWRALSVRRKRCLIFDIVNCAVVRFVNVLYHAYYHELRMRKTTKLRAPRVCVRTIVPYKIPTRLFFRTVVWRLLLIRFSANNNERNGFLGFIFLYERTAFIRYHCMGWGSNARKRPIFVYYFSVFAYSARTTKTRRFESAVRERHNNLQRVRTVVEDTPRRRSCTYIYIFVLVYTRIVSVYCYVCRRRS